MSNPKDDGNYTSHNQDKNPATDTNPHPTVNLTNTPNKHHGTATTGPKPQQHPPIFDIAHHGWDASNVPTAKCDLCHRQRCGTLQKCRVCKLSICQACCVSGRLQSDPRHTIDTAVDWDAPPTLRKRKRLASEMPSGTKKQGAGATPGRKRRQGYESKGPLASSFVVVSDEAARAVNGEASWQRDARFREYGCDGPMEPRLSVAPASYYPLVSRAQGMNELSPKNTARYELQTTSSGYKRSPAIEEVRDVCGNDEQYRAPLSSEGYHKAPAPELLPRHPVSSEKDCSQAAPSRPVLPPITPLLRDRRIQHQRSETFQISSDILNRLDHLLHHHHQQSISNESWPLHEQTDCLGTSLANAARESHHASSPPKPLDHCLREEVQAVWTSRAFIAQDPDTGRRYRRLLAAMYFASTRLGLEPRGNAAREWLCGEERKMREMGYEATGTKTAQLLDFLQEVGIWYLQQVQR
ncbi:hypothetical protein T069G_05210 [Trichoderma breve]|uniref:Uncharacterized protein n=1 Tax=Trichoderma breve TaxID=2034170 RepID=A0A9W9BD03_9HYPO|nr:hypothetical protein T069G_05210 [Trichoderma breve]KAJ4860222.1 hypothetical protein T069G_05210 [Trichoderma breve]